LIANIFFATLLIIIAHLSYIIVLILTIKLLSNLYLVKFLDTSIRPFSSRNYCNYKIIHSVMYINSIYKTYIVIYHVCVSIRKKRFCWKT